MIVHPLVLVGIGTIGQKIARELADTAVALDADAPVQTVPWTGDTTAEARLETALRPVLRGLLEAGAVRSAARGRVGLDVLVVGHVEQVDPDEAARVLDVVSGQLASDWGVMFPASRPPAERAAWGTVLLALPPLHGEHRDRGLAALNALQAHRARAVHPLFSRALILPSQTRAGQHSAEAVSHALRATAQALFLSGLRESDHVQALLSHRNDDRFLVGLSAATAELPLARLRRYARWRLALDGLDALVQRAEHPTGDPARAEALVARLDVDGLLEPFREGEPAQRVRRHAATLSGAADRLPDDMNVRLIERDADLRQRFKVLLGPATKPPPDRATDHPEHHEILRVLDREEAFALGELGRRIEHLLAEELEPSSALEVLPHLERALVRAAHHLDEDLAESAAPLPAVDRPPPPTDPGREAVARALDGRPRLITVLPLGAVLGGVFGCLAGLALFALIGAPTAASSTAAFSSGAAEVASPLVWPAVLVGALVGLLAAAGWCLAVLRGGALALQDALVARRTELEELWRRGGGGQPGRQAAALLAVRRRRTADGLRARLSRASARLADARTSLRVARDDARAELEQLRVGLGATPRRDDLTDLLGQPTPLHRPLLEPRTLAERLAQVRPTQEPDRVAQHLLEQTWPEGGLVHDLPAANRDALERACEAGIPHLGAEALLAGDPAATQVEQRLQQFIDQLTGGLAAGLDPRDENGDPLPAAQPWLALGPRALRSAVEQRLRDRAAGSYAEWSDGDFPWIVVLATWTGLDVASVRRGAR